MSHVVVDASIALAWCFPDETSDYADSVLVSLEGKTMLVPSVWSLELANAILVGERRNRLNHGDVKDFLHLLENLSLAQDSRLITDHIREVTAIARKHNLSAYDASYLELAIRRNAPFATLDGKLQKAAKKSGVALFANKQKRLGR